MNTRPATYKVEYITGQCTVNNTMPNHIYLAAGNINEAQYVANEHLSKEYSGSRITSVSHICDLEIVSHGVYNEDYKRLRKKIEEIQIKMDRQEKELDKEKELANQISDLTPTTG